MGNSKIDWLAEYDKDGKVISRGTSWNPVTGCNKISDGCKNCYAERITNRFDPDRDFSNVQMHRNRLFEPQKWKSPRKVFVCSMSDLFNDNVDDSFIHDVLMAMDCAKQHTYLILTKRPERMSYFFNEFYNSYKDSEIQKNWWLGVTIESQKYIDRIEYLFNTPAYVRFLSIEPMLSEIDLSKYINKSMFGKSKIDWIAAGCESGINGRDSATSWFRKLRNQCIENNIRFFLKQMRVNGKIVHMPLLDGMLWNQFPNKD